MSVKAMENTNANTNGNANANADLHANASTPMSMPLLCCQQTFVLCSSDFHTTQQH